MKRFCMVGVALGIVLLGAVGCVTKTIEPEYIPRVSTAMSSDGTVSLSWPSRDGYDYRIYILNPETRAWVPLKGVDVIRGTGEVITIQDRQNPRKPLPWYSVRPEKR